MNILFINHFFVGFMVSEIPRVSIFGYFRLLKLANSLNIINICGCTIWKRTDNTFVIKSNRIHNYRKLINYGQIILQ